MPTYYELLLDEQFDPARAPVESKRLLAHLLTTRFHGEGAATSAESHFDRLHVRREAPDEVEEFGFAAGDGDTVHLPHLLRDAFGISGSEGRRLLEQGGVRLNGEPLANGDVDLPADRLDGALLQVGKRRFRRLRRVVG
jgi:tyrosyl-tRNA synthetase